MTDRHLPLPDPRDIPDAVNNPDRLQAVRDTNLLDTPYEEAFDQLSQQAQQQLKVPVVLISLVDQDRDFIKSQIGLPQDSASSQQITAHPSFCQLTVTASEPVVINDTQAFPTLRLFPSVSDTGVRAHLGIPLKLGDQPVGNCCAIDFMPRQWSEQDVANLQAIANLAMVEIAKRADSKP